MSDAGLASLAPSFPGLTCLRLSYCRDITDAGLRPLAALTSLGELCLYNAGGVSEAGIGALVKGSDSLGCVRVGHHTGALRATSREGLLALVEASTATRSRRRTACRVQLLGRNPGCDSAFERRSVAAVLAAGQRPA